MNVLLVALGGGMGALARYGLSLLPISKQFPVATFLTNLLGAFLIGLIAAQAGRRIHHVFYVLTGNGDAAAKRPV